MGSEISEPSLNQYGVGTVISLHRRINWGSGRSQKLGTDSWQTAGPGTCLRVCLEVSPCRSQRQQEAMKVASLWSCSQVTWTGRTLVFGTPSSPDLHQVLLGYPVSFRRTSPFTSSCRTYMG